MTNLGEMIRIRMSPRNVFALSFGTLASPWSHQPFLCLYILELSIYSADRRVAWQCFPLWEGSEWLLHPHPFLEFPLSTPSLLSWCQLFSWRLNTNLKPTMRWPLKTLESAASSTAVSSSVFTQGGQMEDSQKTSSRVAGTLETKKVDKFLSTGGMSWGWGGAQS